MENYYKILEIDIDASQETIEKVYKILVKKYHPDLQSKENKKLAEEKIKKINEAYSILSIPEKRKEYDISFKKNTVSIEEYNALLNENIDLKSRLKNIQNKIDTLSQYYNNSIKNTQSYSNPISNSHSTNNFYNVNKSNTSQLFKHIIHKIIKLFLMFLFLFICFYILLDLSPSYSYLLIIVFIIIIYYFSK